MKTPEPLTRPQAQEVAQRMWTGRTWTLREIHEYITRRGVTASLTTVYSWADPEFAERRRRASREHARRTYRKQHGVTRPDVADAAGLLIRIRALDEIGLTAPMIAKVIKLDHDVDASAHSIARTIADGALPPRLAARLVD